ncbi:MAG: AI-2E family transporter [Anaerolineae bacterium]|nr:AI-2E family transporter [Anaerolineae bacterium]
MNKNLIRFGAAVLTTLLALVALWQFRGVVVTVLLSLALAAALRPLVARLVRNRLPVRGAWLLLYLAVLSSFGTVLFSAGEAAINEVRQLAETISVQNVWQLPLWLEGSAFQLALVARLPAPSQLFEAVTGDQGQLVLPTLLGVTQGVGSLVSGAVLVLLLSLYWSSNQIHFERLWLSLLPAEQRSQVRDIVWTIELDLGAYLRVQVVQSLLVGLLLSLGYWLLGSPYPVLLALCGALICLIPVMGAPLALLAPLLVGLLTSVQVSLLSGLVTLIVLLALEVWVKPRFFSRNWNNPMLTVLLLVALADVFGLPGILVAPPLSIVCQILWNRLVSRRAATEAVTRISDLEERLARVQATVEALDEPPPLITSSMARLTQLLEKAAPILHIEDALQPAMLLVEGENL